MEYVLLPQGFLDLPAVADLTADYKFVLVAVAAHPKLSAAAVLTCSPYFLAQLPLPQDVFWGIVFDLESRGIVVADVGTREVFIRRSFDWHRAPAQGEDTPWARQVRAASSRVNSLKVRGVVLDAISSLQEARLPAILVPANLITAMPFRGPGQSWTATEILVHLAAALDPCQTAAGIFRPSLPALAAFCSLPIQTLLECIKSLAEADALFFEDGTGEMFSPARLRCAKERDIKKIKAAAAAVSSKSIFKAFQRAAKLRFPEIRFESNAYFPVEGMGVEYIKREVLPNYQAANQYDLRYGPFKKNAV